jgi:division protein CdvB (Snf7/Vps24/ESCRT-III family)
MENSRSKRFRNGVEEPLSALMRSVVDARFRLERARERLRDIEQRLRSADPLAYERQREKALGDYIDAISKARVARTQLLKQLREHAA